MKIGKAYHPSELRLKHWEAFWETIGFSKRQALKRSLDFADRVSASMKTSPENEVETKIQEIIAYQVTSLRTTLKQA